ncbi:hypothetical protein PENTCL1PPCAC_10762, partial [Pristionchus entomophagus]
EREAVVDFSPPFFTSGLSMMIRKRGKQGRLYSLNPYSAPTWLAIVLLEIMSIATSSVLYAHMKKADKQRNGQLRIYIWLFSLLMCIGCTVMITFSVLQHLCSTSALNEEAKANPIRLIESAEELVEQDEVKYGMVNNEFTHSIFEASNSSLHRKMMETMKRNGDSSFVSDIAEGIAKVRESDGEYAFILDDAVNTMENERRPCDTRKIGEKLTTYYFAVATRKGSDLSPKVHKAMESIKARGDLDRIYHHWFIERSQCQISASARNPMSKAEQNVTYSIYGMIFGVAISVVISLIVTHFERKREHRPVKFTDEETPMTA